MRHTTFISRETSNHRKYRIILIISVILGIGICLLVKLSNSSKEVVQQAAPIATMAMDEFDTYDALSRQEFLDAEIETAPSEVDSKEPEDPFLIRGRVKKNQTLFVAMKSHELDLSDVHQVIAAMQQVVDFKRTKPGDSYEIHLDQNRRVVKFVYEISPEDISIAEREGQNFVAHKVDVNKRVEEKLLSGTLTTSLYDAFTMLGESGELSGRFMQLFKYDIDFGTSSQQGDKFEVLVEKITLNGAFYQYGRLYAATYESRALNKNLTAYYYENPKDSSLAGYYDQNAKALKRSFLKIPVIGCKMTSPYNLKRMHPILKRVRPHYGIDWAGPTGTKIMSFSDGVVTYADWKGGNGNLLVIEHPHGYTSLYAHLQGFAKGVKKGAQVKQGQVVAYLGNTGISTGPHLHFGVKKDGKYIDPLSVDTTYAFSLTGRDLTAFNLQKKAYAQKMHTSDIQIASITHPTETRGVKKSPSSPDNFKDTVESTFSDVDVVIDSMQPQTETILERIGNSSVDNANVEKMVEEPDDSVNQNEKSVLEVES